MTQPYAPPAAVAAALEQDIATRGSLLHGIASRSTPADIAAEVARLNQAVREGADGLFDAFSQPGDFQRLLLAGADATNRLPPAPRSPA